MIKKIILIRHAKSDWNQELIDYQRPILKKSIQICLKVSKELNKKIDFQVDKIYSSSALRALETAEIFLLNLNTNYILSQEKELYTFSLENLVKFIQKIPNEYKNVIILGHNNAIFDFINNYGNKIVDKFPTSACVCIQFEINKWEQIINQKGITNWILIPKNL